MQNLDILLPKVVSLFFLLPLNLLVLGVIGILVLKRSPRLGRGLLIMVLCLLYAMSTPIIVNALRRQCETVPPLDPHAPLPQAEAIVVLTGGAYPKAPEYGENTINGNALERMRYAARLYRLTGKPVLVTGRSFVEESPSEAQAMSKSLEEDFHVPVQWIEDQARTTFENAQFSAAMLRQHGIQTVYLVTHATHMPRAQRIFERMGMKVIPAPTSFASERPLTVLPFLPQGYALAISAEVLHEWIGQLWYEIKSTG